MTARVFPVLAACVVVAATFACKKAQSGTPAAPTAILSTGPDNITLKATAPAMQSPVGNQKLTTPEVVLRAGAAALENAQATPVPLQYRFQVFNPSGTMIAGDLVNTPVYTVTVTLAFSTRYTWRVRAEAQNEAGPWSATGSFITRDPPDPHFINDPLTNGRTLGKQIGGEFIPGVGWKSTKPSDGIEYNISTCDDCTIEFDITNIGKGEGVCCTADLKFLSMGDGSTFNSFGAFRDHPWKMHLIQRGDGDGTGLEIIWRNGGTDPEGNPGDHRIKMNGGGPDFEDDSVFHFVVKWTPEGYEISVGTDGGPQVPYLIDGFGEHPYAPPNHTIQLGCVPRGEGFPSAIYRNFKIRRN